MGILPSKPSSHIADCKKKLDKQLVCNTFAVNDLIDAFCTNEDGEVDRTKASKMHDYYLNRRSHYFNVVGGRRRTRRLRRLH